jgi:hypothetical protein
VPAELLVTLTVTVQLPLAGIEPLVSATEPLPATAATVRAAGRRRVRWRRVDQARRIGVGECDAVDRQRLELASVMVIADGWPMGTVAGRRPWSPSAQRAG